MIVSQERVVCDSPMTATQNALESFFFLSRIQPKNNYIGMEVVLLDGRISLSSMAEDDSN